MATPGSSEPTARRDLALVLGLVREGTARTVADLARSSGLGRKAVTQRVEQLIEFGLLCEGELGPSTGGRSPREITFATGRGRVLVCELDTMSLHVGLADLAGRMLIEREEAIESSENADEVLGQIERLFDGLLAKADGDAAATDRRPTPLWGIGLGVLGPVDMARGRPVEIGRAVLGWSDYPVRDRLEARFGVPVWVDNEVNLMALGEFRAGRGRGCGQLLYVKLGFGIGGGLISEGKLLRGGDGAAGELGHLPVTDDPSVACECGQKGCCFAVAGGCAVVEAGTRAAVEGRSPALARVLESGHPIWPRHVAAAAAGGDPASMELLEMVGENVGRAIAMVVNVFNPRLVLVGGELAAAGDLLLAAVRRAVYQHALPLATRNLRIDFSPLSDRAGLVGAAFLVLDTVFSPEMLPTWIERGSPAHLTAAALHEPDRRLA